MTASFDADAPSDLVGNVEEADSPAEGKPSQDEDERVIDDVAFLAPPSPEAPYATAYVSDGAEPEPELDEQQAEQESARDLRLLRFVYTMAALTAVVAITLYAGGWFLSKDGDKQTGESESVAVATPADKAPVPADQPAKDAPGVEKAPPVTDTAALPIPSAPPVAPDVAQPGDKTAEAPVITGGKPKPKPAPSPPEVAPDAKTPPVVAAPAPPPVLEKLIPPADESKVAPAKDSDAVAAVSPPSSPAVPDVKKPSTTAAQPGSGTPQSSKPDPKQSATGKDVPNLRVLAPALVRPKPSDKESSSSTSSESQSTAKAESPSTKSSPPPKVTTGSGGRYLVQLASVGSPARAQREWGRLQKAFPELFGNRELIVEKREIVSRGTFYRVQTGRFETLKEANAICDALKVKKQGCLAIKR